jgi:hypothetical protein
MYAVFPLLKCTEEKYDGGVAADMIKYEFGEDTTLDICNMAIVLLKHIRALFSDDYHHNIIDMCRINFMIEYPMSVGIYANGMSRIEADKYFRIHSACKDTFKFRNLDALFDKTCGSLGIENPFEKWQQLFWQRYNVSYDFSARPHTCGYESWKDYIGKLCCCNIIYYDKCNKDMLLRIMPSLEKLGSSGGRFNIPGGFGSSKLIGKDATTAIISIVEHLRELHPKLRDQHIIDTAKIIFMTEFPILLDTDSKVRDATYKIICDRTKQQYLLSFHRVWKRKFEVRYGAALISDD